jgi:chromate reductase
VPEVPFFNKWVNEAGEEWYNSVGRSPHWRLQVFLVAQEQLMKQYQIAVIIGSLRQNSVNRKLAGAVVRLAPDDFCFWQVSIGNLPLFNQDDESHPSEAVQRFRAEIQKAHALLFVTPEYNRSIPGVLKNALDQGSRPFGQNVWAGKPAGILGVSSGVLGTALAQQHLRNILSYLDVPTLTQPEVYVQAKEGLFDEKGNIGPGSQQFLQNWMNRYVDWVKKLVPVSSVGKESIFKPALIQENRPDKPLKTTTSKN